MHHVMFDIDGTLVESYDLDSELFCDSVKEVTGIALDADWGRYHHVTDSGILQEVFEMNGIPNKEETEAKIKRIFIAKLEHSIASQPIQEIPGAESFLSLLKSMSNVIISIATGGWYESAVLKLNSAGIDIDSLIISSSNDHISRTEIMKHAASKATRGKNYPCTYFGDGIWDKKACEQLGFNFVLVGNKVKHNQNITSFKSSNKALAYVGL
ncbi:Haloacid dehalogenase domain protein hydrolase [Marinomonas posidonica IVIA-Po-181]|uniref:Haloacid dehalogenase domain protein hydrolase n=1 Tax=Marinomonas posidonica (strain CECT 7376 / NCIMB 14433 / IVIA-Po-181) TaxID=491952 RepID=F6CUM8_MARPP|nr:HAD family hydrolase [Marinomonas posidonica]AEF54138.1 Haloacid dehalogenase domain protein hydrolase [Marinomonas posidonica IVIA-Po-181]